MIENNFDLPPMGNGPDQRLIELFSATDKKDTGAIFFFFKESGELILEGRCGDTQEAKMFLAGAMSAINSWMSESGVIND
jgi:hypothetical protein